MKIRTTAPTTSNKYYLKKPWGYNPCILGNKDHRQSKHSVLVNCTGCETGRFAEIIGEKKCRYLGNTHAENYIALAKKQGLEIGTTPRPGAAIVWQGVGDAAGHTGSVEKVISENEIQTLESGWSYKNSYVLKKIRTNDNGNWGLSLAKYSNPMFIYNPNIEPYHNPKSVALKEGDKGEEVKWVQWAMVRTGYKIAIDGKFGPKTKKAVKKFQKKYKLTVDGYVGPKTQAKIKVLYTLED